MSQRGLCSRREADYFIESGWVMVDGAIVDRLGSKVNEAQRITLMPQALKQQEKYNTILVNKPPGYVSGQAEKGYRSAVMLITASNSFIRNEKPPSRRKLAPAGRLDIDSRGLIVYTEDGRIAKQLIGADSRIEKEYLVNVYGEIDPDKLEQMRFGLELDGKPLRPARIEKLGGLQLRFVLQEGRKRQIRRMCEEVGLKVTRLVRVRIGGVKLGKLPVGEWRHLRQEESF